MRSVDANRLPLLTNPAQRFVMPEAPKASRRMSMLTPEKVTKLKPQQVREFRQLWDDALKEFGAVRR